MTPFQKHVLEWSDCKLCPLCETRDKVVLCRGKLPADVLFIGEAPGPSEDTIGQPFKGPAGRLLDTMIDEAYNAMTISPADRGWDSLRMAFTNLVACIPKDDSDKPYVDPSEKSIKACRPRLEQIINIAKPKLIVCVGKLSQKYLGEEYQEKGWNVVHTVHPAFILKTDTAARVQRDLLIKRTVAILRDGFSSLV